MDNLTRSQRRKNMQNIRSTGTAPETLVMQALQRQNVYFARNVKSIIGKPDIVFRRKKVAVFIDSDFWHAHPGKFIMPQTNKRYWKEKIQRNKERDSEVNEELRKRGWKVIRIWEHDIKSNVNRSIRNIMKVVNRPPVQKLGRKIEFLK